MNFFVCRYHTVCALDSEDSDSGGTRVTDQMVTEASPEYFLSILLCDIDTVSVDLYGLVFRKLYTRDMPAISSKVDEGRIETTL